jgi:hypothetical protein
LIVWRLLEARNRERAATLMPRKKLVIRVHCPAASSEMHLRAMFPFLPLQLALKISSDEPLSNPLLPCPDAVLTNVLAMVGCTSAPVLPLSLIHSFPLIRCLPHLLVVVIAEGISGEWEEADRAWTHKWMRKPNGEDRMANGRSPRTV